MECDCKEDFLARLLQLGRDSPGARALEQRVNSVAGVARCGGRLVDPCRLCTREQ